MSQVGFERVYLEECLKKYFSKIDLALFEKLDWKLKENNKLTNYLKNDYIVFSAI